MPFGVLSSDHTPSLARGPKLKMGSPMPFGVLSSDHADARIGAGVVIPVTNAFRRSVF
jgi:hypothetical protein